MGNKKNVRKRMPTAKKMAADTEPADDSDSPRPTSTTRPKPRPTYKGSTKAPSDPIPQTSKKVVNRRRQSVTSAESDVSMPADDDAGEDEAIEIEEEDHDGNWDEEDEEDEEDDSEEVNGHQQAARSARAPPRAPPGM
jgi:hypothetical protein